MMKRIKMEVAKLSETRDETKRRYNKNLKQVTEVFTALLERVDGTSVEEKVIPREIIDSIGKLEITWSYLFDNIQLKIGLIGPYKVMFMCKGEIISIVNGRLNKDSELEIRRLEINKTKEEYTVRFFGRMDSYFEIILSSKTTANGDRDYNCMLKCLQGRTLYTDRADKYKDVIQVTVNS